MVARDVFFVNHPADVLIGESGCGIAVPFLAGKHFGNWLIRGSRLQQFQGDGLVSDGILLLFALPFFAGQAAHVIVKAAGRTVVVLQHLEILETAPQQHPVAVHGELVREVGSPRQVPGDLRTRSNGRNERILPEFAPEQEVGRAIGVAERCGALAVVEAVAQYVADGREDVVVTIQR